MLVATDAHVRNRGLVAHMLLEGFELHFLGAPPRDRRWQVVAIRSQEVVKWVVDGGFALFETVVAFDGFAQDGLQLVNELICFFELLACVAGVVLYTQLWVTLVHVQGECGAVLAAADAEQVFYAGCHALISFSDSRIRAAKLSLS